MSQAFGHSGLALHSPCFAYLALKKKTCQGTCAVAQSGHSWKHAVAQSASLAQGSVMLTIPWLTPWKPYQIRTRTQMTGRLDSSSQARRMNIAAPLQMTRTPWTVYQGPCRCLSLWSRQLQRRFQMQNYIKCKYWRNSSSCN